MTPLPPLAAILKNREWFIEYRTAIQYIEQHANAQGSFHSVYTCLESFLILTAWMTLGGDLKM